MGFNLNLLTYEQPMDEDEIDEALDQFMQKADEMVELRQKMEAESTEYEENA